MFTPAGRDSLRDALVAAARADQRIAAAALTGSAASGTTDRWSDIDLALSVARQADFSAVLADWTGLMYREHGALHHMDLRRGATNYRVFLLASTLQVDIALSPAAEFGAIAPTFLLLFGTSADLPRVPPPDPAHLVGLGWLYALHARSSIARGRAWQAEYMISGVRDHVIALACLRHGVTAVQGRGSDDLPPDVLACLADALVSSLETAELRRALAAVVEALHTEITAVDAGLASRLAGALRELAAPDAGGTVG